MNSYIQAVIFIFVDLPLKYNVSFIKLAALNSTEQDKRWYEEAPRGEETVRDGDSECPQHRPAQTAQPALKPRSEFLNYY